MSNELEEEDIPPQECSLSATAVIGDAKNTFFTAQSFIFATFFGELINTINNYGRLFNSKADWVSAGEAHEDCFDHQPDMC